MDASNLLWGSTSASGNGNVFAKTPVLTTAEAQRWKEFNSYEMRDFRQKQREALKNEINNISHKIASAREAQLKASQGGGATTYGGFGTTTMASWKVPEIEQINRNFNENARFFSTHKNERRHGLKYVPPPVAENV